MQSQRQDNGPVVLAYASRGHRKHQKNMDNYSSMKLELLGLKRAITEKCKDYLVGAKFVVLTDNNPMTKKINVISQTDMYFAMQRYQKDTLSVSQIHNFVQNISYFILYIITKNCVDEVIHFIAYFYPVSHVDELQNKKGLGQ